MANHPNRSRSHKAQVNCDGAPGSLPGWHTFDAGTKEKCDLAAAQYLATGGLARVRVVSHDKRDNEE